MTTRNNSRNVYNHDELNHWLDSLKQEDEKINQWIARTLRRYMLSKWRLVEAITELNQNAHEGAFWFIAKNLLLHWLV